MTDRRATEPFDLRVADLIRAYTDVAAARRIDPVAVSRVAMSAGPVTRSWPRMGVGLRGRPIAGDRWVAAAVAAILVAVVALAVQGRLSESRVGQSSTPASAIASGAPTSVGNAVPDTLRHAWQRPSPVAPGPDVYGSGFLTLTGETASYGRDTGSGASQAVIAVAGPDTLLLTATAASTGCQPGEVATYRWVLEGTGTVLTLTPLVADACPAREALLAGPWVRADLPPRPGGGPTLAPGTHVTSAFDPFADPARTGRLGYVVPAGWELVADEPESLVLHSRPDDGQGLPSRDLFLSVLADPAMAAEFQAGVDCNSVADAPGVGHGRDELLAAIQARPSLVSTPPTEVKVGSFDRVDARPPAGAVLDRRMRLAARPRDRSVDPARAGARVPSSASARTLRCDSSSSTWATANAGGRDLRDQSIASASVRGAGRSGDAVVDSFDPRSLHRRLTSRPGATDPQRTSAPPWATLTAMSFAEDDLARIRAAEEVDIETQAAGRTGPSDDIWIVVDGDDASSARFKGPRGRWFREATANPAVALHVDGRRFAATAIPATDPDSIERTTGAVIAKYAGIEGYDSMLNPDIFAATLRLEPA